MNSLDAKEKSCLCSLFTRGPINVCAGASGRNRGILAGFFPEHPAQNLALPLANYPIAWLESKQGLRSQCVCLGEKVEKGCGQLVSSNCKTDILNQHGPVINTQNPGAWWERKRLFHAWGRYTSHHWDRMRSGLCCGMYDFIFSQAHPWKTNMENSEAYQQSWFRSETSYSKSYLSRDYFIQKFTFLLDFTHPKMYKSWRGPGRWL